MLPGQASPLSGQNRSIDVITPATAARLTLQQSWMRLDAVSLCGASAQPQAHHSNVTPLASGEPMSGLAREQRHKTALLIIELQGAMGGVNPLVLITMTIEPGPAPAAGPAAQQSVGERLVSKRGVTHSPRLRRPTAKSRWSKGMPWRRPPFLYAQLQSASAPMAGGVSSAWTSPWSDCCRWQPRLHRNWLIRHRQSSTAKPW